MSAGARNDFLNALRTLLPSDVRDGSVNVTRSGDAATVTLTLPGQERPMVSAVVRVARPAPAKQGELFEGPAARGVDYQANGATEVVHPTAPAGNQADADDEDTRAPERLPCVKCFCSYPDHMSFCPIVAPPVEDLDGPAPFVVVSAVLTTISAAVDVQRWAEKHDLHNLGVSELGGFRFVRWGLEGGGPKGSRGRAVAVIPRADLPELARLARESGVDLNTHDAPADTRGGSVVGAGTTVLVGDVSWRVRRVESVGEVSLVTDSGGAMVVRFADLDGTHDGTGRFVHRAPATPKPSKPTKAPTLHAKGKLPEADKLAKRGAHTLLGLVKGHWTTLRTRKMETAPEWHALAAELAAKGARVRLYDGAPRCTWDSLDGGSPR